MRQYITIEQWDEITNRQHADFLRTIGKLGPQEDFIIGVGLSLPTPSIGELIAYLDVTKPEHHESYTEMYGPYDGGFLCKDIGIWRVSSTYEAKELIDALWMCVKAVLQE